MRYVLFFLAMAATVGLIYVLHSRAVLPAPLGRLLNPQEGIWQNAEPADADFSEEIRLPDLVGKAEVFIDERLVPHVFAENEQDLYFIQGYLHAKFRLWQMEFQTRAAAGRVSEVVGPGPENRIFNFDRNMRRLGMVYAAEKSVLEADKDPQSKAQYESYTRGVNAWIGQLTESQLPIEYKLLGYYPEQWSTLKTALFLKYMSYDLAGGEEDFEYTNARSVFSLAAFENLYYVFPDSLRPIAVNTPEDAYPAQPAVNLLPPAFADSVYFGFRPDSSSVPDVPRPDPDNGSNNWAVSGAKTQSGRPILCNDPHLGLNLPSLWFEMQITTPAFSAYGASFPGSPNIIIGFNEHISWGFTNAGRDVKDYYEIEFQDNSQQHYLYEGNWVATEKRLETIHVKGKPEFQDTVYYTVFGPVMYDKNHPLENSEPRSLAVRWKAHDASNDGLAFYQLNHARDYAQYREAIRNLKCPGQNCVFASRSGDIAIWQQGEFPAKWKRQGDFIMPGTDASYAWRGWIPENENPHMVNPTRGYVSSANQLSTDSSYPYYTGNVFPHYRGWIINRMLDTMTAVTPDKMKTMQCDNYNLLAEQARPFLLQVSENGLTPASRKYLSLLRNWNLRNDPGSEGATVFNVWWNALQKAVWKDEFDQAGKALTWPGENVLVESLLRDTTYMFLDRVVTPEKEGLPDLLAISLVEATDSLSKLEADGRLAWDKLKATRVNHLLRVIEPFSRLQLPIGGGTGIINATKTDHGPSWRMVVHMTDSIEAYGIYPGGQSGNPGSKYYDAFVDDWAAGKYNKLWLMKQEENRDPRVKWTMTFKKL